MLKRRDVLNPFKMMDEFLRDDDWFRVPNNDPITMTVSEDTNAYYVRAVVPGFSDNELSITSTGDRLTISGHREEVSEKEDLYASQHKSFERSFSIPRNCVSDDVSAEAKNGILVVNIPKRKSPEAKQIPIKSNS